MKTLDNIIKWFKAGTRVRAAVGLASGVFVILMVGILGVGGLLTSVVWVVINGGALAGIVCICALVATGIGIGAYFDQDSPL